MYRSVRYKVNRDEHTRTADPNSCHFRIKRNTVYEATMANTIDTNLYSKAGNPENETISEFMKTDYIKSFNSMMEPNSRFKVRQISVKER